MTFLKAMKPLHKLTSYMICAPALLLFLMCFESFARQEQVPMENESKGQKVKLFLAGDVMLGRGIDQAMRESVDPVLYEAYVKDAGDYIKLAERKNGKLRLPLSSEHVWGDALREWKEQAPNLKLINLETSITTSSQPWPRKGIHYRMHPANVKILTTAGIDHVSLANNHVLDWGRPGLLETLKTLDQAGIKYSGAGINEEEAASPSVFMLKNGRILVYSFGSPSSGIPPGWAAEKDRSGVNFLSALDEKQLNRIKQRVQKDKKTGDLVVFSVHWGGNWGYKISEEKKEFAHELIDEAGVDLIFGHSSHHPLGIEVYNGKLIIYGAGDFINDYEGISGQEEYRGELSLMYFPEFDVQTGDLLALNLVPMEIKKFRLNYAEEDDLEWMQTRLSREGQQFGTEITREGEALSLWWK